MNGQRMDLAYLQAKLMAAARSSVADDRVPYAFEKRIMARLAGTAPLDTLGLWGRALWRAALPCLTVAMLLGVWSLWRGSNASFNGDFPKEFETAVLAAADQSSDTW